MSVVIGRFGDVNDKAGGSTPATGGVVWGRLEFHL